MKVVAEVQLLTVVLAHLGRIISAVWANHLNRRSIYVRGPRKTCDSHP